MTDERKPTIIKDFPGAAVEKHLRETGALPNEVCYTAMDPNTLLEALGDDAAKWATAFNQHVRRLGHKSMSETWLTGWFANAIERSSDVRRWRREGSDVPVAKDRLQ